MGTAEAVEVKIVWLFLMGTIITFLLVVTVILFIFFYQQRVHAHKIRVHLLENENSKKLLYATIQVQEEERKRIAVDLHDDVAATLSAAKLYLGGLGGESEEAVNKIRSLMDSAIGSLRDILYDITPKNLERFGLATAIHEICGKVHGAGKLNVLFEHNGEGQPRLPLDKELSLYRISQELLNNTIKHADATEVHVTLQFGSQKVRFAYQDNGKGFDLKGLLAKGQKSLGLSNMESRAEVLGTKINYDSNPNGGFSAFLEFQI